MKSFVLTSLFAALAVASPALQWHSESQSYRGPSFAKRDLEKRCDSEFTKAGCTTKLGPMPVCADVGSDNCCESDWADSGYMTCGGAGGSGSFGGRFGSPNGGPVCLSIDPC